MIKKGRNIFNVAALQRGRDSNPRYLSVYTLSRRAPSTTRTPLYMTAFIVTLKNFAERKGFECRRFGRHRAHSGSALDTFQYTHYLPPTCGMLLQLPTLWSASSPQRLDTRTPL